MSKTIIQLIIGCIIFLLPINGEFYKEKYRLQFHYSIPKDWMSDPSGLIHFDGYYHMFFQYNPDNMQSWQMHWGHARSLDLIHWEHLPVAIKPYEKGVIFSGSCVFDKDNVTGLGSNEPPLLAYYGLHDIELAQQSQAFAYSLDRGITWTHYHANPVIPNGGIKDFRDPNIFERDGNYYMAVSEFDRITFLTSKNLIDWTRISEFGLNPVAGDKQGVWECPSVFTLKDEQGNEHDVLILSENIYDTVPKIGSSVEYFIGQFNGTGFNTYNASRVLWIEHGHDHFASLPYYNDPLGRIILIGWMANWNYAMMQFTAPWRGQMAFPRELKIKTVENELYLIQSPIDELNSLIDRSRQWHLSTPFHLVGNENISLESHIPFKINSMLKMDYAVNIENATSGIVSFKISNNHSEFVLFHYNVSSNNYSFDRRNSGNVTFSPHFVNRIPTTQRVSTSNILTGQVLLDTASIEIFADEGLCVFSALFYPTEPFDNIQLIFDTEHNEEILTVNELSVSALNSIWT